MPKPGRHHGGTAVIKGHPRGLAQLFFTEMWERLAFYTMLNVLLLYATDFERGGLGLTSAEGNEIYGLYLAFVYFTPFPGGLLADRYLGYRRAVLNAQAGRSFASRSGGDGRGPWLVLDSWQWMTKCCYCNNQSMDQYSQLNSTSRSS